MKGENAMAFEKLLGCDVRVLRLAGLYSMNSVFSDKKPRPTIWEPIVFTVGLVHIFFVASCEFFTILRTARDNPNYAIGTFTAMFSGILCAVKGLRLWFCREKFRRVLRLLAIMWNESKDRSRMEKIIKIATETRRVSKWYIVLVTTLVTSYAVRPYILFLHHKFNKNLSNVTYDYTVTTYPTTYPFWTTETTRKYVLCVSWEQFVIVFVALYWISSDIIFAQITTHMAIQFRILGQDLKYVTDSNTEKTDEKSFIRRLSRIARRHHDLYRYCTAIQKMYNPIIFLTMLLTAVNMCFCVFRVEKELKNQNWDEVVKYLFHAVTLIVQAIIYCNYADKLTHESGRLAHAAYETSWTNRSREFKTLLIIIIMRSQKMFTCTAYGFFTVNLSRITVIVNAAASYFTILKTLT